MRCNKNMVYYRLHTVFDLPVLTVLTTPLYSILFKAWVPDETQNRAVVAHKLA